jgi:hypothetical protein
VQRLRLFKYREDGVSLRSIMAALLEPGDDLSLSSNVALADLHMPFRLRKRSRIVSRSILETASHTEGTLS